MKVTPNIIELEFLNDNIMYYWIIEKKGNILLTSYTGDRGFYYNGDSRMNIYDYEFSAIHKLFKFKEIGWKKI